MVQEDRGRGTPPQQRSNQDQAVEAAFRASLPEEAVALAMDLWHEQRRGGGRVSLRPLAEQVAAALERPQLADPIYVELLRHSFRPRRQAEEPAAAAAADDPLRSLLNALHQGLARRGGPSEASAMLEGALQAEFPDPDQARTCRDWLAGGRPPEPAPDEPTGRSLVNRLWEAACRTLGPADADAALAEAVHAAEAPGSDPEQGPRRYL